MNISSEFKKLNGDYLAVYGYSLTGKLHIWSSLKGTSLCGRKILFKEKYEEVKDLVPSVCKSCYRSHNGRNAILELTRVIVAAGLVMSIVRAISEAGGYE